MASRGRPRSKKGPRGVFAERFRASRARRGLTQQQAADALGVHVVTVAKWETGAAAPRGLALRFVEAWISAAAATASSKRRESHGTS